MVSPKLLLLFKVFHFYTITFGSSHTLLDSVSCILAIQLHLTMLPSLCLSHLLLRTLHFHWRITKSYSPVGDSPLGQRSQARDLSVQLFFQDISCPDCMIQSGLTQTDFYFSKEHTQSILFLSHTYT